MLFLLQVSYASNQKPVATKSLIPSYSKFSYAERRIGNNFLSIFKLAQKKIINPNLVKKLNSDIAGDKTFKDYKLWPKKLSVLNTITSFAKLKNYCEKNKKETYKNIISQYLNENITMLCFNKYLSELSKKSGYSNEFHTNQIKFIKHNIDHVVTRHQLDQIENILENLRRNRKMHRLYSKTFMNYYILHDKTPPTHILKYLVITPEFTRFLQTKDLESNSTKYVFYQELRKLKKKVEKDLKNKNLDRKQLKQDVSKVVNYFDLTYEYQPSDKSMLTLLALGKELTRKTYLQSARKCFVSILGKSNQEYYEKAIFELMWTYIVNDEYKKAIKYVYKPFMKTPEKYLHNSQLSFWTAISLYQTGRKEQAKGLFQKILKNNPLSYYSILSAKKLAKFSPHDTKDIYLKSISVGDRAIANVNTLDRGWLKRVNIWSELNSSKFLNLEVSSISNHKNFEQHVIGAAQLLSQKENYLDSFKMIIKNLNKNSISFSKALLEILFPTPYLSQIKKHTKDEFDPIIALSLIRQESGFNQKARSRVGARGLMQLMPATARRFKRRVKKRQLYNPHTNISIGTKYFNNLLDRYDNNLVYSLAAYNAGEHRVDRWQNNFLSDDSILVNIENIPYTETRKYVKLIFRNIFFYKLLNDNGEDNQKFNQIFDLHLGFNK